MPGWGRLANFWWGLLRRMLYIREMTIFLGCGNIIMSPSISTGLKSSVNVFKTGHRASNTVSFVWGQASWDLHLTSSWMHWTVQLSVSNGKCHDLLGAQLLGTRWVHTYSWCTRVIVSLFYPELPITGWISLTQNACDQKCVGFWNICK